MFKLANFVCARSHEMFKNRRVRCTFIHLFSVNILILAELIEINLLKYTEYIHCSKYTVLCSSAVEQCHGYELMQEFMSSRGQSFSMPCAASFQQRSALFYGQRRLNTDTESSVGERLQGYLCMCLQAACVRAACVFSYNS